jgi:hypothetical protein
MFTALKAEPDIDADQTFEGRYTTLVVWCDPYGQKYTEEGSCIK